MADRPDGAPRTARSRDEKRHALLVTLNFAAVYVLWGSTYLAIRVGVSELPPALMAGTRFLVAGTALLLFLLARRVPLPPRAVLGPIVLTGFLLLFCGNLLVTIAERTVPSGTAAVIVANLPFVIVILEAMRKDGERLAAPGFAGLALGFAGTLMLLWPKLRAARSAGVGGLEGEIALMGANVCWAIGSIYSKRRVRDTAPLMAVAIEMAAAGAGLTILGLLLGEAPRFHPGARSALAVLWLIVAGSLLGYSAYVWLLSHVPVVKVSTYAYVNPIIAVLLGSLLLREPFDLRMAAGTVVILGGVAVVNAARVRTRG